MNFQGGEIPRSPALGSCRRPQDGDGGGGGGQHAPSPFGSISRLPPARSTLQAAGDLDITRREQQEGLRFMCKAAGVKRYHRTRRAGLLLLVLLLRQRKARGGSSMLPREERSRPTPTVAVAGVGGAAAAPWVLSAAGRTLVAMVCRLDRTTPPAAARLGGAEDVCTIGVAATVPPTPTPAGTTSLATWSPRRSRRPSLPRCSARPPTTDALCGPRLFSAAPPKNVDKIVVPYGLEAAVAQAVHVMNGVAGGELGFELGQHAVDTMVTMNNDKRSFNKKGAQVVLGPDTIYFKNLTVSKNSIVKAVDRKGVLEDFAKEGKGKRALQLVHVSSPGVMRNLVSDGGLPVGVDLAALGDVAISFVMESGLVHIRDTRPDSMTKEMATSPKAARPYICTRPDSVIKRDGHISEGGQVHPNWESVRPERKDADLGEVTALLGGAGERGLVARP
eukprot:g7629.t1